MEIEEEDEIDQLLNVVQNPNVISEETNAPQIS